MIEDQQRPRYWLITAALSSAVVALAVACVFLLPVIAPELNRDSVLGFPLGFYLVAQGLVIALIAAVSWLGGRQARVDEKFGAIEDM